MVPPGMIRAMKNQHAIPVADSTRRGRAYFSTSGISIEATPKATKRSVQALPMRVSASLLAEVSKQDFLDFLAAHNIPLNYDVDDLEEDLLVARELSPE
jgi:hypothetical protein